MKFSASKSVYGNSGMVFDLRLFSPENLIMEIISGVFPMLIIFMLSNGYSDFASQVGNYIPSHEIQLAFVCYLAFGLVISISSFRLHFSPFILRISFASVSTCISMLQALAGFLVFSAYMPVGMEHFGILFYSCPATFFFTLSLRISLCSLTECVRGICEP